MDELEYERRSSRKWDCRVAFVRREKLIGALIRLLLAAGYVANFLYNHFQHQNQNELLKKEQANRKLSQLDSELEEEYRHNISTYIKSGENNLTLWHEELKQNLLQKYDEAEKPTEESNLLALHKNKLNKGIENMLVDFSNQLHAKSESGENLVRWLTQKYNNVLRTHVDGTRTGKQSRVENFELQEKQIILDGFQAKTNFPIGSPGYNKLKKEMERNLNQIKGEYEKEEKTRDETLAKAYVQVLKLYQEEYIRAISQPGGNDLIPSEVSFEFHEKITQIAISKCVHQKLVSANPRVQQELRLYFDKIYEKKVRDNIVIGIDFGETYTRSAVYFQGKVQMIPHYDRDGKIYDSVASSVGFNEYDEYVGQSAQNIVEMSNNVTPIVYDMKKIIMEWSGSDLKKILTFQVNIVDEIAPMLSGERFEYSVVDTVAKLYNQVRENAERFVGVSVQNCVVTFPGWFDEKQTNVVIKASNFNFTKVTILKDYIAAAIALQHRQGQWSSNRKVIYASFDRRYWYFYIYEGSKASFQQIVYNARTGLYSQIHKLVDYCSKSFCEMEGVSGNELSSDNIHNRIRRRRLFDSCNKAVALLNNEEKTIVRVPEFFGGKNLTVNVARKDVEVMFKDKLDQVTTSFNSMLNDAKLSKGHIAEVIIGGEYSGMPKIREIVGNYFPGKKIIISYVQSEDVIAYGAAVKGAMISAEMIKASN